MYGIEGPEIPIWVFFMFGLILFVLLLAMASSGAMGGGSNPDLVQVEGIVYITEEEYGDFAAFLQDDSIELLKWDVSNTFFPEGCRDCFTVVFSYRVPAEYPVRWGKITAQCTTKGLWNNMWVQVDQ